MAGARYQIHRQVDPRAGVSEARNKQPSRPVKTKEKYFRLSQKPTQAAYDSGPGIRTTRTVIEIVPRLFRQVEKWARLHRQLTV